MVAVVTLLGFTLLGQFFWGLDYVFDGLVLPCSSRSAAAAPLFVH